MSQARESHVRHWPPRVPRHLTLPQTNVFHNAEVSAARYPDKPFIVFYDTAVSFAEFKDEAERIAGFLQLECGVKAGDRVLLYMQNSPQWVLAFYDCRAATAFVAQDLLPQMQPLLRQKGGLQHLVAATYSDYLNRPTDLLHDRPAQAHDQCVGLQGLPAEVEALMYRHPAIQEACVIAAADPRRGETVKALVVLKPGHDVTEQQIIDWAHEHMAAYKSPRSGSGKVMWRELQERENQGPQRT